MMDNETILKIQEANQRSQNLDEQLKIIEQQLSEMSQFQKAVESLESSDEKEIMASLGKGVYIPAELKEKQFYVEVGAGVFVKKKISETKEVIEDQTRKLQEMKVQITSEMVSINTEMEKILQKNKPE